MIDSLLCVVVSVVGWGLCRLPPSARVGVGMALGQLAGWCQPARVRIGEANLTAAFGARFTPAQRRHMIQRMFRHLGAGIVEMLCLPAMDEAYFQRFITIDGREHIDQVVASGRPIMFMTAHFGNWEMCSIIAAFLGHPIVALARAQGRFPKLYRLLVSYRESKGCRVVHKGGAIRELIRALRRGEPVGIVGDQASRQGMAVEFFGRPALFATGPYELAARSRAMIIPAFLYRLRGPHHRLVLEPPFECSSTMPEEDAVRRGIAQFAALLAAHIERDPAQWLWVHKRWKHTPARRVLVLSDGKLGHLKQSLALVQAMKARGLAVREDVVEVRYRNRLCRGIALLWAWGMPALIGRWYPPVGLACLRLTLEPVCARRLASSYADVVISCGASTAPVNLLVSAQTRARSVVIMNPAPLPLHRFHLAFVPMHDRVPPRPNVVRTYGALSAVNGREMASAAERLRAHPRFRAPASPRLVAVLLGGDTRDYRFTAEFVRGLIDRVLQACQAAGAQCLVTTSRRTPPEVERWLEDRLAGHARCACLLLASRDPLEGTVDGMLGLSQAVVVTGESVSMVTEACASGRGVIIVDPPRRQGVNGRLTKSQRYVRRLVEEGYASQQGLPDVEQAVRWCLTQPPPARRLDPGEAVQAAVARFI